MSNMTKAFLVSVPVGLLHAFIIRWKISNYEGEGLGGVAYGLELLVLGILIIPIVLGIVGALLSSENRFRVAVTWFFMSALTILAINMLPGLLRLTS